MKSLLDIRAVEVDLSSRWRVVSCVDNAELTVGVRTCLRDVVDVEAGVDLKDRGIKVVELITSAGFGTVRVGQDGERALWRRELEVCVQVGRVIASVLTLASRLQESLIEIQEVLPELDIGQDDDLLLDCSITNDRVIDLNTC